MSGHSKWHQIHRQKGVTDSRRGALFTRLGKAIIIAARLGGGDPAANVRLRIAIEQARAANMPKNNIERAIKRGTGELVNGQIETVTYEGFGPGGSAWIIECLTDNRNRSNNELKKIFNDHNGNLGSVNSVNWLFDQVAITTTKQKINGEQELALIDVGASDIEQSDDAATVYSPIQQAKNVRDALTDLNIEIDEATIGYRAKEIKKVTPADHQTIQNLIADLEDDEDVINYYTNADSESEPS